MNVYLSKIHTSIQIPDTQWHLKGASEAARHTGFYIPELKIKLDAGIPSDEVADYIFITHCHYDHTCCLPSELLEKRDNKIEVLVPIAAYNSINMYVNTTFQMTKNNINSKPFWNLNGMTYENTKQFKIKNINFIIEPFKCTHSVPCIGYGFIEIRQKLKQEFIGKMQDEILNLKNKGIELSETKQYPHFCFIGDTDHKIFINETNKLIKYKVIIIECTYLNDIDLKNAKQNKHMHWNNLKTFVVKYPNIKFILYHFSAKYKPNMILDFFKTENLQNVIPFVNLYDNKN